jgi:hypothetical protein
MENINHDPYSCLQPLYPCGRTNHCDTNRVLCGHAVPVMD